MKPDRLSIVFLAVPLLIADIACTFLVPCPRSVSCIPNLVQPMNWVSFATVAGLVLGSAVLIWACMLSITVVSTSRRLSQLGRVHLTDDLVELARMVGVTRIASIDNGTAVAFCAGAFRPTVFVSPGLLLRLGPDEVAAVLIHEQDHLLRREPLRRMCAQASARLLFFLPVVSWWAKEVVSSGELRADRAALDRVGPKPLARALWALRSEAAFAGGAAFAGLAQLRVAQLLGDPVPRSRPPLRILGISAIRLSLAFGLIACLATVVHVP